MNIQLGDKSVASIKLICPAQCMSPKHAWKHIKINLKSQLSCSPKKNQDDQAKNYHNWIYIYIYIYMQLWGKNHCYYNGFFQHMSQKACLITYLTAPKIQLELLSPRKRWLPYSNDRRLQVSVGILFILNVCEIKPISNWSHALILKHYVPLHLPPPSGCL